MKRKIYKLIAIIMLLIPIFVHAKSTDMATDIINLNNKCSINVHYNDYEFDSTNVRLYHVASVSEYYEYTLTGNFSSLSNQVAELNNINKFDNQDKWNDLRNTINPYVINIEADKIGKTNNNEILFDNLECGLYFIVTDKIENSEYSLNYESFFVNLPDLNTDNKWNYNVYVYPKIINYYENYSVMKQWIDDFDNRPKSIDVNLYKDGQFYKKVNLNDNNNWTYNWISDGKSSWDVMEDVPSGYYSTVKANDNKFIVVNIKEELPPNTNDNINLFLYIFILSVIGFIFSIITLYLHKQEK